MFGKSFGRKIGYASYSDRPFLLEVIRSATPYGAQALHEPKGKPIDFGIIRPGLLADMVERANAKHWFTAVPRPVKH